jgi:hypothetical protein
VVALFMEWYKLPAGEQADTKQEGNTGKNWHPPTTSTNCS